MSISIVLTDNHNVVRDGINSLFLTDSDFEVKEQFNYGKDCLSYISKNKIDIVITDLKLPDIDGFKLLEKIRKTSSNTKVVFLTESVETADIVCAYDLEADGYISKTISFNNLTESLKTIMNGEKYYEPDILPLLNKKLLERDTRLDLLTKLTNREKQILCNVANGMSNKEIAVECNISERTVKNHLSNIFQKIEVADRTQAAVFAIKTNLVKL